MEWKRKLFLGGTSKSHRTPNLISYFPTQKFRWIWKPVQYLNINFRPTTSRPYLQFLAVDVTCPKAPVLHNQIEARWNGSFNCLNFTFRVAFVFVAHFHELRKGLCHALRVGWQPHAQHGRKKVPASAKQRTDRTPAPASQPPPQTFPEDWRTCHGTTVWHGRTGPSGAACPFKVLSWMKCAIGGEVVLRPSSPDAGKSAHTKCIQISLFPSR